MEENNTNVVDKNLNQAEEKEPEKKHLEEDTCNVQSDAKEGFPEIALLEEKLKKATQALQDAEASEKLAQDKALRALAELENFKKRKQQEVDSFKAFASEKIILGLLPILDSFDLAIAQLSQNDHKSILEGIFLIHKQMKDFLEKEGVKEMDVVSKPMDPQYHQPISMQESKEIPSGHIIQCVQKGYFLHERVLRPAMVVVSQ